MKTAAILAALVGFVSAHMEMSNPPALRSKFNRFTTDIDYSMTSPLNPSGSDFPCKGYHSLMGTPQGQSVATYNAGQSYRFTITGGTPHDGGSCQASLSYDRGATWTVIHSYIGNCPLSAGDTNYDFTIPNDTPAGQALFGWSWFNKVGNREMYMNCAVVTIVGRRSAETRDLAVVEERGPQDPFRSRPAMFVANVGRGCGTIELRDLEFPNPGPDVTRRTPQGSTAPPTGSCSGRNTVRDEPTSFTTKVRAKRSAFATGASCEDGAVNCVEGSKYQRCDDGAWTDLEEVYPGTACEPGKSEELLLVRDKSPADNYISVLRQSRAAAAEAADE